jgi:hypothetical protein
MRSKFKIQLHAVYQRAAETHMGKYKGTLLIICMLRSLGVKCTAPMATTCHELCQKVQMD